MRAEDFLVTTKVGAATRRFVWKSEEPREIDIPHSWFVQFEDDKIRFKDGPQGKVIEFPIPPQGERIHVQLPESDIHGPRRSLVVDLLRLRPPKPLFVPRLDNAIFQGSGPLQLTMYHGQRFMLAHYRPVGNDYTVRIGSTRIFRYHRTPTGYSVTSIHRDLKVKHAGAIKTLHPNETIELHSGDFMRAMFVQGVNWWRFNMAPTPDSMPPVETDESEVDEFERARLQKSTSLFLSLAFFVIIVGIIANRLIPSTPKPLVTNVELKKPLIVPMPKDLMPKPTPIPTPTPKPVVEEKKPEPPPPLPPPPKKEVVKKKPPKEPKAPKVARPKPKPEPLPKPEPPPPKAPPAPPKPAGPTPEQLRAQQKAAEAAAQQQQMLKSLNFLSSSKNRPNVDTSTYAPKKGKFGNAAVVGEDLSKGKNATLDKMASDAPTDGTITTRSARTVHSDVNFGKTKGLNDVQGKVSLKTLYKEGKDGFGLDGGHGMEISGPGQISESEIEKALAKFLARFQYCYEKALLKDAGLAGNVVIGWTIAASGSSSNEHVLKSQLNNKELHNCMTKILHEVNFPHPKGGTADVKKTFSFTSTTL
ncbi:MAG: hypothetical protein C5B49_09195 [Bdellovibrio sp.]|nr:MAG: hypothetical protein C5B49_09195 [Bdellovibrio sp.]